MLHTVQCLWAIIPFSVHVASTAWMSSNVWDALIVSTIVSPQLQVYVVVPSVVQVGATITELYVCPNALT